MVLYKKRREIKQIKRIEEIVGSLFSKINLSPNQWTTLVFFPVILASYFIYRREFLLAGLFFLISGFIDFIDGAVARYTKRVTKKGAYLDTIVDRYVEFIILVPLVFMDFPVIFFPFVFWVFLYLFGSLMTTYSKAAAKEKDILRTELKGGLLERAERIFLLTVGIFLAVFDVVYLVYTIILLALLSNVTAFQRIFITLSHREKSSKN